MAYRMLPEQQYILSAFLERRYSLFIYSLASALHKSQEKSFKKFCERKLSTSDDTMAQNCLTALEHGRTYGDFGS